ncbi:MAG: type II toxin-antitoxin system VapC family toxin [Bythopirellula sp.]|nr:type II toxin-antitoxin system VapC family toxin [Bythopirellula sp.]
MNPVLILDCSVTMTWLFEQELTSQTANILDRLDREAALVPTLWFLEVTNVVALAERKGRITIAESSKFLNDLALLKIEDDAEAPERSFDELLPLCRTHQLTSYDAVYLELAVRRKLPLATLDEPLRKAAKKLGVKLLGK